VSACSVCVQTVQYGMSQHAVCMYRQYGTVFVSMQCVCTDSTVQYVSACSAYVQIVWYMSTCSVCECTESAVHFVSACSVCVYQQYSTVCVSMQCVSTDSMVCVSMQFVCTDSTVQYVSACSVCVQTVQYGM